MSKNGQAKFQLNGTVKIAIGSHYSLKPHYDSINDEKLLICSDLSNFRKLIVHNEFDKIQTIYISSLLKQREDSDSSFILGSGKETRLLLMPIVWAMVKEKIKDVVLLNNKHLPNRSPLTTFKLKIGEIDNFNVGDYLKEVAPVFRTISN